MKGFKVSCTPTEFQLLPASQRSTTAEGKKEESDISAAQKRLKTGLKL